MFQPVPGQFTMVDPERSYTFRTVGSTDRGEIDIAVVTVNGQEVPFEYRVEPRSDETGVWYEINLGAFGYSVAGDLHYGLGRVTFASDAERRAMVFVAIEGVLVWSPGGYGVERGDGYSRLNFDGKQYRLSDFGPYLENAPLRE